MVTINPVVSDSGEYLGSEIADNRSGWSSSDADIIERSDGSRAHIFGDVELDDEVDGFNFDAYAADLRSAYPALDDAIAWASRTGAAGFDVDGYNTAIDVEDLEAINAYSEKLIAMYEEALQSTDEETTEEVEPTELDEWYNEIDSDVIDTVVDEIADASYSYEQVSQMEELAEQYTPGSTESTILSLGVAIGNGDMSGEEALQWALDNFNEAELTRAYFQLQQQLSY
jgi:hypothetical protein